MASVAHRKTIQLQLRRVVLVFAIAHIAVHHTYPTIEFNFKMENSENYQNASCGAGWSPDTQTSVERNFQYHPTSWTIVYVIMSALHSVCA